MKNTKIIGKFLLIMSLFGVFALGVAGYAAREIKGIDERYSSLLSEEQTAALYSARSNRTLQNIRAATLELIVARDDKASAAAEADLKQAHEALSKFMTRAVAASLNDPELSAIASDAAKLVDVTCAPAVAAARTS